MVVRQAFTVTRLGESISKDMYISHKAFERSMAVLHDYQDLINKNNVKKVYVIGTEMLRRARNSNDFTDKVKRVFGWPVHVISGEEEGRMTYRAAVTGIVGAAQPALVVDVGGGSTEIVRGVGENIQKIISLAMGVVRMAGKIKKGGKLSIDMQRELTKEIHEILAGHSDILRGPADTILIGSGGTITTLAAIKEMMTVYDPEKIHGYEMKRDELESIYHHINPMPLTERRTLPGMLPGREDVLPYGILIYIELMKISGIQKIYATDRGLRFGYLQSLTSTGD